jgi:serine/threonine protein phosphatase PrpC
MPEMDVPRVTGHGRSDVGRVRSGNEDAVLVGTTVFAVADGMGGHRAGEVASAAALEPVAALDGRTFEDPERALAALTQAATEANTEVSRRSTDEPDLEGMGTTLTALLVTGRVAHLVHVGDSRAYLERDGRFVQLTDDHTLVQALLDQGRITADQVATHPHRSVITRAVGVAHEIEVDGLRITLRDGDRILLCSDGLSGVVDDDTIARAVRDLEPAAAVDALVDAANAAGGPDNITVVIVAVDSASGGASGGENDPEATAVLPRLVRIRTDEVSEQQEGWAARYSDLSSRQGGSRVAGGAPSRSSGHGGLPLGARPSRERLLGGTFDRIALRMIVGAVATVLVVAGLVLGARLILDRAYLVGVAGEEIVIYRGFDVQLGPIDLKRIHERPGVTIDQVPPALRPVYEAGRPAADLGDARRIVRSIPLLENGTGDGTGADGR